MFCTNSNMFNKIIKQSMPVVGTCRLYYSRTAKIRNNFNLDLRFIPGSRWYAKATCPQFFSQQNLEGKLTEKSSDIDSVKNDKQKEIQEKKADKAVSKDQAKPQEEHTDESNKKKFTKRTGMFEKKLILYHFEKAQKKEKGSFLECLRMYENKLTIKTECTAFIYTALKYMEEFGVHKDLEVYKKLLDIFPKERMVPTNQFQTLFMHYPREQYCAVSVLEQMEDNGVIPDPETELLLLNIFGRHGIPLDKYWRMMYWMPKFKNLNPYPVPKPFPNDVMEIAKLAIIKISSVDIRSTITIFDTNDIEDSVDKTWIVSGMSPLQRELLTKHDKSKPIYVEGPFQIYVATKSVDYFTLRADPIPNRKYPDDNTDDVEKLRNPYLETKTVEMIVPPTVHEEDDGTYFAVCATGTSTKDSLLSWIRSLQKDNPVLGEIAIIFTLRNLSEERFFIEGGADKRIPASESKTDNNKVLQ